MRKFFSIFFILACCGLALGRENRSGSGRMYSAWGNGQLVIYPGYNGDATEYFVDSVNGADANTGLSWEQAKATLDAAVDLARYLPGTTTIDDTKDHHAIVNVAPGHYNESLLFSGYNIEIIGSGCPVPGKDYGVSVNYDGAVTTTAVIAFSGSGIRLANLHVYCDAAIPAIYNAGGDNNIIENCVIECDGVTCTYGIQMESMKGSWIKDCVITSPLTAGIFLDGGADRYAINGGITGCQIMGDDTAGVKGIYAESTMTGYNFRIGDNYIDVEAGGVTSIGIDCDMTGNIFVADNYVVVETGASSITTAGHGQLNNHVSTNGTVTDPKDDD